MNVTCPDMPLSSNELSGIEDVIFSGEIIKS